MTGSLTAAAEAVEQAVRDAIRQADTIEASVNAVEIAAASRVWANAVGIDDDLAAVFAQLALAAQSRANSVRGDLELERMRSERAKKVEDARRLAAGGLKAARDTLAGEIPDPDKIGDKTRLVALCEAAEQECDRVANGIRVVAAHAANAGLEPERGELATALSQIETRRTQIANVVNPPPPPPLFPTIDILGAAR